MANQDNGQQKQVDNSASLLQNLKYTENHINNIDMSLRAILGQMTRNPNVMGSIKRAPTESQSNVANAKWKISRGRDDDAYDPRKYRGRGNPLEDFEKGFKDQLLDSLAGGNFKKNMRNAMDTFTKEFGMDIRNIPQEAARSLAKKAADAFNSSETGKAFKKRAGEIGKGLLDKAFKGMGEEGAAAKSGIINVVKSLLGNGASGVASVVGGNGGGGSMLGGLVNSGGTAAQGAKAAASNPVVQKAAMGLAKLAAKMGPWGLLVAGIIITAVKVLTPFIEGAAKLVKSLGKSFNRDEDARKKMVQNAIKRQQADLEYLAEQPFKILQEAAEKWASTWDSNLRKIGQTQGYDKESVYALYESYAERLRSEELGSIINATDIVDKLSSVLDSGLSGKAAEEFAYVATKLSAAIPTQDFFGYVDTYASIAANAMSQGATEAQALQAANDQLEQFASNLLYSSRELAGGFTTGLKNGSDLFKDAVQIAQSAKTSNASEISGTLTSVSAIIGAVAPDLANSLVSNVVQAAIGGNNNTSIVALRSLAGVNAGNTEFLRLMATNPQAIFTNLFANLANLQNMSPDNYMEVAEGLADVFGIDKAAFARVDFNYLAQAISEMEVSYDSLNANLDLLISGQTTTSAEQLKAQEINRVILDEGLAYVIDSEAGRMIQEHMWDEQRANALMQNEYAVSLQGAALEFLEGIRKSFTTLLNFLNPAGFIAKGVANMTQTIAESIGNEQDIQEILKLGAIGNNSKAFNNLTTRGKDLGLTSSLVEMLGGTKGVQAVNWWAQGMRFNSVMLGGSDAFNRLNDQSRGNTSMLSPAHFAASLIKRAAESTEEHNNAISSRYDWNMVGKSMALGLQSTAVNSKSSGTLYSSTSATQAAMNSSNKRFQEFLDTASEAAKTMTYDQWVASAKSRGISDFSEALREYGRTESELQSYFEANEAQAGAKIEAARKEDEQLFRDENRGFWDFASGSSGVFQSAMWFPFFGEGQKYDTRMDSVDNAIAVLQERVGLGEDHTVIGGLEDLLARIGDNTTTYTMIWELEQIRNDLSTTFVSTSSMFHRCLTSWIQYIADSARYEDTVSKATAWSDLKNAEKDQQTEATLALANALGVFSAEELKKLDPQLQTNVLLGEIVVILEAMRQQNNNAVGFSIPDTLSALGMGLTYKTGT